MQEILLLKANELAIETGFMERERVLTGSSFATGVVMGWQANPEASLEELSQSVGNAGTPISRQGLNYRFNQTSVRFMKSLLEASLEVLVTAMPVSEGILSRFSSVDLVDSSYITLPNDLEDVWRGSGGNGENASVSSLKLNVRLDLRRGELKVLELSDGRQHDLRSEAHLQKAEAGSLRIADLGYFKIADFARIEKNAAYFLSRYKVGTHLYDLEGEQLNLPVCLPQKCGQTVDTEVLLGQKDRLKCRLLAERVPLSVLKQRHQRLREIARQNQTKVSDEALTMAQWTIYLTNVPTDLLATQEVFILGRYRWQIELLFKLWKSDLGVDKWTSSNPHRILTEIYGKLIAAIITHWLLLVACWHNPRRSFRLAMPTIRNLAWHFANSLHSIRLLNHAFDTLCRSLSKSKIGKSQADPRAWQLIYDDIA